MSQKNSKPWLKAFPLDPETLAQIPSEENPLVWCLQNQLVDEAAYLKWAADFYQLPALAPEFFQKAFGFQSLEKFLSLPHWSAHYFPVDHWDGILYVACLEPSHLSLPEETICYVIAPASALEEAWKQRHEDHFQEPVAEESLNHSTEEVLETKEDDSLNLDLSIPEIPTLPKEPQLKTTQQETPKTEAPDDKAALADLDFSQMDGANSVPTATAVSAEAQLQEDLEEEVEAKNELITNAVQKEILPLTEKAEDENIQSVIEDSQAKGIETPGGDLEKKETTDLFAENIEIEKHETQERDPETKFESPSDIPSLDDLAALQVESPQQPPGVEDTPPLEIPKNEEELEAEEPYEDDYTPVSHITGAPPSVPPPPPGPPQPNFDLMAEKTVTDNEVSHTLIPEDNRIEEADLGEARDLEKTTDKKEVIAHIFGCLKKDYKKLMWVQRKEAELFFPKYVYGEWKLTAMAWKQPVNLTNPNIFRISYKSSQAFHGPISMNPYNEKYMEGWCRGQAPDYATIVPVSVDNQIDAFIVAFDTNTDFDAIGSLKKIENLVSISKQVLERLSLPEAA